MEQATSTSPTAVKSEKTKLHPSAKLQSRCRLVEEGRQEMVGGVQSVRRRREGGGGYSNIWNQSVGKREGGMERGLKDGWLGEKMKRRIKKLE